MNEKKFFEKIGITPGPWEAVLGIRTIHVRRGEKKMVFGMDTIDCNDAELAALSPDMFLALVRHAIRLEKRAEYDKCGDLYYATINTLEKYLSWPEIKAIYEECQDE